MKITVMGYTAEIDKTEEREFEVHYGPSAVELRTKDGSLYLDNDAILAMAALILNKGGKPPLPNPSAPPVQIPFFYPVPATVPKPEYPPETYITWCQQGPDGYPH